MKKASKRLYEPRYTPNSSLSKSKAYVSLRPQRTMTTPSEATNQPLNSTPQMESKIKTHTEEGVLPTTTATATEEVGFKSGKRAYIWAVALTKEKMFGKTISSDREIERVQLDLPNQRVVNGDCLRTRVSAFNDNLKLELEKLLTFYCKKENITYKQGLNEVAAPFINFRKDQVDLSNIYNYLVLFIDKFLPTAFIDKDFLSLQCCFRILNILLRYHDPAFYTFLARNEYPPEIYATPWFLTLFANKLSLEMVYLLWDIYILENDPYLIFFFSVALLIENKNKIMAGETYMIPQNLSNLNIENASQMRDVYKRAIDIRLSTPPSFLGSLQELDIFKKGYLNQTELRETMQRNMDLLEQLQCLLMSPYEIVNTLYSTEIQCSNPKCANNRMQTMITREVTANAYESFLSDEENEKPRAVTPGKRESKARESFYVKGSVTLEGTRTMMDRDKLGPCIFCKTEEPLKGFQEETDKIPFVSEILNYRKGQKPWLEILILDLRINKDEGLLPKSHTIDLSKLDDDTINGLINDLIELRSYVHFVFMTTDFNSASFRNYTKETREKKRMESPPPGNRRAAAAPSQNNIAVSEEDALLFRFLEEFLQNGFPYLSVLEGGFNAVNKVLHDVHIEVLNHNIEKCSVCNGRGDKKKSLFNFFNRVFDKTGKKINLIVEGMNSKTPAKTLQQQSSDSKNYTKKSNTMIATKKDKSARASSDLKEKPRSITSIPTPPHTLQYLSPQDVPDFSVQTSTYISSSASIKTRGLANTYSKPNDLISHRQHQPSEFPSLILKDDEEAIEKSTSRNPTPMDDVNTSKNLSNSRGKIASSHRIQPPLVNKNSMYHQDVEGGLQWEVPFKSYFDLQVSPRTNNHFRASMQQKRTIQEFGILSPQELNIAKKEIQLQASLNYGIPYSPGDTLHASRYVFDSKKRVDSKENEQRRPESTEHKQKRFISPQEERTIGVIEAPKTKSSYKSNSVTQSIALSKGSSVRKALLHDDSQVRKSGYKMDGSRTRSPGTPITQLLATEEDSLAMKQKTSEDFKARGGEGEWRSYYDHTYHSMKENNFQKPEQLISPKSMLAAKKTTSGGKAAYQSVREADKNNKTNPLFSNPPNLTTLSLNMTDATFNSLAATLVEFPPTENSSRRPIESFRKEILGDRRESIEKSYDLVAIRSPLKITQSPSPIRGGANSLTVAKDKRYKENLHEESLWRDQNRDEDSSSKVIETGGLLRSLDNSQNDFYARNGLLNRVRIGIKEQLYFYKLFENIKFSYFICDHVLEVSKDEALAVQEHLSKRIILISKDFLISVQYENEVLDNLRLLQKGFSLEKMMQYTEERRNLIGSLDTKTPFLRMSNGAVSPKTGGLNSKLNSSSKERPPLKKEITIEAMFPTKLLLRITSKKYNGRYLSFYFKLPVIEKLQKVYSGPSLTFTEGNIQSLHSAIKKDDYLKALKDVSETKDPTSFIQSKSLYYFDTDSAAQECIHITKDAYNQSSSYLNEKFKKK